MATRYLYIDDESTETLQPYIRAVKGDTGELEVYAEGPKLFDDQVGHLVQSLPSYDGLILDWRLDQKPIEGGRQVQFRAGALAQEIRTRSTEGNIKELPIILWSTYPRRQNSYNEDHTSHDLFDIRYDKEEVADKPDTVRAAFLSLAQGYKDIAAARRATDTILEGMLGLEKEDYSNLDLRFLSHFLNEPQIPVHEYARFILKQVIWRPGPLISEELLAARLGVDKDNTTDWDIFLDNLPPSSRYKGPFHAAWPRWWSHLVEKKWWRSLSPTLRPLSIYRAEERVAILRQHTGIHSLAAARPLRESYGDNFQTICEYYRRPLDPLDGVIIDENEPEPWQHRRYMSLDAALERRGSESGLNPHPTEQNRIREIKKSRTANAKEKE